MNELIESLKKLLAEYSRLGVRQQLDYEKFYLYSIVTHSTAIEGSTITEIENQLMFDEGICAEKPLGEQLMNIDLKKAYDKAFNIAESHQDFSVELLCGLSSLVMKNTGILYNTIAGSFDSAAGDLRLLNVSAGRGGRSYMAWQKVPDKLEKFCAWINENRSKINAAAPDAVYRLSFEAHYRLVSIHPWADGNGRMARLVMNMIQTEFGVVPSIVKKSKKTEYINSLAESRSLEDVSPFMQFMFSHHAENIAEQINDYNDSIQKDTLNESNDTLNDTLNLSDKEKIIFELIKSNDRITIAEIMTDTGFSRPTVTRALNILKEKQLLERVGSRKTGRWHIKKMVSDDEMSMCKGDADE